MAAMTVVEQPHEVVTKVLRRARVSKMTRALQDRLALANIKIKHGWEHRSMDSLGPEIETHLKRKRSDSNAGPLSDTSSVVSGHVFSSSTGLLSSSPLTGPVFSDDLPRSGSSVGSRKRTRTALVAPPLLRSRTGTATRMHAHSSRVTSSAQKSISTSTSSWKRAHHLPESSPIAFRRTKSTSTLIGNQPQSFRSEASTIPNSPSSSEDDDQDIPLHSFQIHEPQISSSPPRTPPPDLSHPSFISSSPFSSPSLHRKHPAKEGADLLLYLASSPSPALRVSSRSETTFLPPSTPPSKHATLPSSMLGTPGNLFGFAPVTPGTNFNFADFVNVTPSPAQAAFPKTPGTARTPGPARRRLQLTPLVGMSPNADVGEWSDPSRKPRSGRKMELGGELSN